MSYSFSVAADTKEVAKQKIADNFDGVIAVQESHQADRDAAVAAGQAFVDILTDPKDGEEIAISMNGSLSWHHTAPEEFRNANVSVSAYLRAKTPAAT